MLSKILLATTAAVALVTSAAAADLTSKSTTVVVPPLPFSWTGFYLGGTIGSGATASKETGSGPVYLYPNDHLVSDGYGAIGGIEAGYNYQMGSLLLGIEADYSASNANTDFEFHFGSDSILGNSKLRDLGSLRGRLGYATDRGLVYVTGGLAVGKVNSSFSDYDYQYGHYNNNSTRLGSIFGAGVEYAIASNWTVKAEGLYYSLAKKSYGDLIDDTNSIYADKPTGLVARVGVNYLFSSNPAVSSAPSVNWTGAYLGSTVGAVQHFSDLSSLNGVWFKDGSDTVPSAGAGVIGGLGLGYNYQVGSLVVGLEADYSLSSAKASGKLYDGNLSSASALQDLGTIRGRLGYAADKALLYATGGVAIGSVRSSLFDDGPGYDNTTKTRVGSVFGGGIEYALTEHVSLKGEGLYYQFSDKNFADVLRGGYGPYTEKTSGLVTRLGLNYKL